MNKNSELKNLAVATLEGKWGDVVLLTLLVSFIEILLYTPSYLAGSQSLDGSLLQLVAALIVIPLSWGFEVSFLPLVRQQATPRVDNLLSGYRDLARVLGTGVLTYIYIFLWSLLLIVPGIIKCFSYALTPYILADRPDLKYNGAIELSMRMMQGYKAKLFWLYLSFIGWALLCILTLGIGFLWLIPYINTTLAHFYEERRAEFEAEQALDDVVEDTIEDYTVADV